MELLIQLLIFSVVIIGNAYAIIAFNRACQYQTQETDQRIDTGEIIPETKMILWKVKYWCDKNLGAFWSKPVYACPTCMGSIHGIIPFLITTYFVCGFSYLSILHWAFYTLTLSGLTTYLNER